MKKVTIIRQAGERIPAATLRKGWGCTFGGGRECVRGAMALAWEDQADVLLVTAWEGYAACLRHLPTALGKRR